MDGSELMSCLEVAGLHRSIKGYLKQVCEVVTVVVGMSSATWHYGIAKICTFHNQKVKSDKKSYALALFTGKTFNVISATLKDKVT